MYVTSHVLPDMFASADSAEASFAVRFADNSILLTVDAIAVASLLISRNANKQGAVAAAAVCAPMNAASKKQGKQFVYALRESPQFP